jgi:hypothetical protein
MNHNLVWMVLTFTYFVLVTLASKKLYVEHLIKILLIYLGLISTAGLAAGIIDFRLVGNDYSRYLLLFITLVTVKVSLSNAAPPSRNGDYAQALRVPLTILFAIFLFTIISLSLEKHKFAWLLNTWDGGSQPGIVTQIWHQGNINYVGEIPTGFIGYPRAVHFVEAIIGSITHGPSYSANFAVTFFAVLNIVFYCVLVVSIILLTISLTATYQNRSKKPVDMLSAMVASLVVLLVMFSSTMVKGLFFLHSVNFWIAITCVLVSVLISLRIISDRNRSDNFPVGPVDILCLTSCTTLTAHSYPVLLPLMFLVIATLCVLVGFKKPPKLTIKLFSTGFLINLIVIVVGVISFINVLSYPSTEGDRFKFTGALDVLPVLLVIATVVGSLTWLAHCYIKGKGSRKEIVFQSSFVIGSTGLWGALWILAGSFDRTYGLNYYPKKYEYYLLLAMLPFCAVLTGSIFTNLAARFSRSAQRYVATPLIVGIVAISGLLDFALQITKSNSDYQQLGSAVLFEANESGPSTIVASTGEISLPASIMANSIDLTFWDKPSPDVLLYNFGGNVIANSGVLSETRLCEITDILLRPVRVHNLYLSKHFECWK